MPRASMGRRRATGRQPETTGRRRATSQRTTALLLTDVTNGFAFPGSRGLVRAATDVASNIEALARRARAAKVPVIYVNDNFGRWRSDFRATFSACAATDQPGHRVTLRLRPHEGDYFVLKPRHSGFYSTVLDMLLADIGVDTLVLTGFATNLCVALTAYDAHVRGYRVLVPSDCTASNRRELTRATLRQLAENIRAGVASSRSLRWR